MRKIILFFALLLLFVSCNRMEIQNVEQIDIRYRNCENFENFTVPTKSGYSSIVMFGEDTLAVTESPITIKIPKGSTSLMGTKSEADLKINYEILQNTQTYSKYWQAVMFEDSKLGDYDYNDLIIHVENRFDIPYGADYGLQTIRIQPIALGGAVTIKLGCVLADKSEYIISNDVRRDLFGNEQGFINVYNSKEPIRYKLEYTNVYKHKMSKDLIPSIAWFIEIGNRRHYAVSTDFSYRNYSMFNEEIMPYGIVAYNTFDYPEESVSISTVYPGFNSWLNNGASNIGSPVIKHVYKYSLTGIVCPDGKIRRIWDYLDLE